jgi:hypothetical protein
MGRMLAWAMPNTVQVGRIVTVQLRCQNSAYVALFYFSIF